MNADSPRPRGSEPSTTRDAFDAILDEPSSPPPAGSAWHGPAQDRGSAAQSTLSKATGSHVGIRDFTDNWGLYGDPVSCGVLAGVGLGALGIFVVLRRAVFVTAALSQAAGLGVALAFYAQIHLGMSVAPVLGALCSGILATLVCGTRPSGVRLARETRVGFVFVATSALAVLVGDRIAQEAHDIAAILFGTAVLVRPMDLAFVGAATALSLGTLLVFGRALTFAGFDPEGARVQGVPARALELGFWMLFAFQVSVTTRALGALPVFGFSVLPAAAGLMLANRVRTAVAIAAVVGGLSGAFGYVGAFLFELPVGACQVATTASFSIGAYAIARLRV